MRGAVGPVEADAGLWVRACEGEELMCESGLRLGADEEREPCVCALVGLDGVVGVWGCREDGEGVGLECVLFR